VHSALYDCAARWRLARCIFVYATPRFLYRIFSGSEVEIFVVNCEYGSAIIYFVASYIFPYKSKTARWPWQGVRCVRSSRCPSVPGLAADKFCLPTFACFVLASIRLPISRSLSSITPSEIGNLTHITIPDVCSSTDTYQSNYLIFQYALCEHAERWLMAVASGTRDSHLLAVSGVSSYGPCSSAKMKPMARGERDRTGVARYASRRLPTICLTDAYDTREARRSKRELQTEIDKEASPIQSRERF